MFPCHQDQSHQSHMTMCTNCNSDVFTSHYIARPINHLMFYFYFIGAIHEQNRAGRCLFIKVNYDSINEAANTNFGIKPRYL